MSKKLFNAFVSLFGARIAGFTGVKPSLEDSFSDTMRSIRRKPLIRLKAYLLGRIFFIDIDASVRLT